MNYNIKKIKSVDELMQLEGGWNALLKRSETNIIYLTFEWVISWWKCFGGGRELFILLVRDTEKLIAIAPLMITPIRFGITEIRKIEFIGTPQSNYSDFIISGDCDSKGDVLQSIYDYLIAGKDCWDIISLNEIPEASLTLTNSEAVLKNSNTLFNIFPDDICPTIVFEGLQKEEIEKKINKKDIRGKLKRIGKIGTLHHYPCMDTDDIDVLLSAFFQCHINKWSSTSTPSMFEDKKILSERQNFVPQDEQNPSRILSQKKIQGIFSDKVYTLSYGEKCKKFYTELIKAMSPKGWVNLSILRFNEKPIAFEFGFIYNTKYDAYTPAYDMNYRKYSPGLILLGYDIKNYLLKNFKEFDLGRGDDPYKFRFSNEIRKNYKMNIYKGHVLFLIDTILNRLRIEIMKHDRLRYAMRGVKNKLTAIV